SAVGRLLQLRPVVYVGLISYSLYLWHWPLIVLVRYAMGMEPITPYVPMLLVVSLALASLSYHFVEQPFRRGAGITLKVALTSSVVLASVLVVASAVGLLRGGFVERFAPAVVQLDLARSPQIPFVNCDKAIVQGCMLGRADGKPTVLLWGDSHLLALAPALNVSLAKKDIKAVFAFASACPPMLWVDHALNAECAARNLAVKDYLLANPHIQTVVMSAYWSTYFRPDGPLKAQAENLPTSGSDAVSNALTSTIQWLRAKGKYVVLIGPVPVYERSVPLALALEKAAGTSALHSSIDAQRRKHGSFFEVVQAAQRGGPGSFLFLDPIQWMCAEDCLVMKGG